MKITVVKVEEKGFDGKDGRVAGAGLTFIDPEGKEKNLVGYGPAMEGVLKWQGGEEHEIEVFRPEGKDQDRFRVPREGGGKREFKVAFANTAEGLSYEQERMDRRTALMQAVAIGAKVEGWEVILVADEMFKWLRKTANGK